MADYQAPLRCALTVPRSLQTVKLERPKRQHSQIESEKKKEIGLDFPFSQTGTERRKFCSTIPYNMFVLIPLYKYCYCLDLQELFSWDIQESLSVLPSLFSEMEAERSETKLKSPKENTA